MAKKRNAVSHKDETKGQRFIRLAEFRMSRVLKYLHQLGNLAGPGYERTPEQADCISNTLREEVQRLTDRFRGTPTESATFQLPRPTQPTA